LIVVDRTLAKISFGDGDQPATMETSMRKGDFSDITLEASGAVILSAFLPKCQ
jgi:hypothetical protein